MDGIEEYKAALQEAHDRMFTSLRGCLADFQKEALATDLRAQFAGQAMAGMEIPNGGKYSQNDHERGVPEREAAWIARQAVCIADALLAALNGGA